METPPTPRLRAIALERFERFLVRTGMSASAFGLATVNDHKFLLRLRRGRNVTLRLIEQAEAFVAEIPADFRAPEVVDSSLPPPHEEGLSG